MALTKVSRGLLSTSIVDNGNATAITIDSSENVGIGNTSPDSVLTAVNAASTAALRIGLNNTSYNYMDADNNIFRNGAGTERIRIDSSGNLLVGKTSADYSDSSRGNVEIAGSSGALVGLSAGNTDSYIFQSGVNMDIFNVGAGYLRFATSNTERMRIDSSGWVNPKSNVALTNAPDTQGLHFGWNYSNGAGESLIVFNRGAGTTGGLTFVDNSSGGTHDEVMRLEGGNLLVGTTTAINSAHTFTRSQNNSTVVVDNQVTSGNPFGLQVRFSQHDPNNAVANLLSGYAHDGNGLVAKFIVRSNGGIANYQANDANLSDERVKRDISPLGSMWDKFKALEIVTFKYQNQTNTNDNIGVIAQQVESVAPEFVDNEGFGETPEGEEPLKTIYTTDLYHAAIKALQEAMNRIETLETKVQQLENN